MGAVGEIMEEIDMEKSNQKFTPNVVLVPKGPESDFNDAETTSIKSIFQNFVTSIKLSMRILSSGKDDCAADVFVDFLKQPDVGQVVNDYVRVTSVVTEQFLKKNNFQIVENNGEDGDTIEFSKVNTENQVRISCYFSSEEKPIETLRDLANGFQPSKAKAQWSPQQHGVGFWELVFNFFCFSTFWRWFYFFFHFFEFREYCVI